MVFVKKLKFLSCVFFGQMKPDKDGLLIFWKEESSFYTIKVKL